MTKVTNKTSEETPKLIQVKFLVSPTGKFNLAYNVGEEASLPEPQAIELEELAYVKFVN